MENLVEKIWDEYLSQEHAKGIDDAERKRMRTVEGLRLALSESASVEDRESLEQLCDVFCDMQSASAKRAFFLGCRLGLSFGILSRDR